MTRTASDFDLRDFLAAALAEDVGTGDATTEALVPPERGARGRLVFREPGVAAGVDAALEVFRLLDPSARVLQLKEEGERVEAGGEVASVEASARAVLTGERLALNLLGRLSGIATLTRRFVDAVEGTGVEIVCTRKTTPLLRALEKRAVRAGGGRNHRFGLYDAILVKDNHLVLAGAQRTPERLEALVRDLVERRGRDLFVQIEVETVEEALAALRGGAGGILFDNFAPDALAAAVKAVRERAGRDVVLEASGGIRLENVRAYAETGVDRISIGALTHSARSLDVSLEIEPLGRPQTDETGGET